MILITKNKKYAAPIVKQLDDWQERSLVLPMLAIKAKNDLPEKVLDADLYVFISQPSVEFFVAKYGVIANKQCMAVGPATFAKLAKLGWQPVSLPLEYSAMGLLETDLLMAVAGKKIVVVCGEPFNHVLEIELTKRGAFVSCLPVYQRLLPLVETIDKLREQDASTVKGVVFASSFSLLNFQAIAVKYGLLDLLQCPFIVASVKMKNQAKISGNNLILLSKNATNEALVAVLKKLLNK